MSFTVKISLEAIVDKDGDENGKKYD